MFGWRKHKTEAAPTAPPALPRAPAHMLAIREEVRAAAIDHEDLARAVLADIRAEQLDVAYDVTDINDWINHYVARAGLSAEGVDHQRVRAILKAQPGVTFKHCGVRVEDRYAGLRARLRRRRGHIPEKVWVFLVSMDGFALRQSGERCSRVLIEDQAMTGLSDSPTRPKPQPASVRPSADSGPIPPSVQRVESGRVMAARRVAQPKQKPPSVRCARRPLGRKWCRVPLKMLTGDLRSGRRPQRVATKKFVAFAFLAVDAATSGD